MKRKLVDIELHAMLRIGERGVGFGLDYLETKERVLKTVNTGKVSKRKHLSRNNKTYCCYFQDNITFYVICSERESNNEIRYKVKTIIVERGRY